MIGHLRGRLLETTTDRVLLDVGGVGYEVHIPLSTYYEVQKLAADAPASFWIHTHVREDALQLFGFWSDGERQIFRRLIAVTGIGPKLAQTVLSGMPAGELVQALATADVRKLGTIPGVGKKTAERMVLELKDKIRDLAPDPAALVAAAPTDSDLVLALVSLGYKRAAIERAVAKISQEKEGQPFPEQLKACLALLSRV